MSKVTIDASNGIFVELPDEWAPLAAVKVPLVNAWGQYRLAIEASGQWWLFETSWDLLMLRLWREDQIELAGRRGDPEAELTILRVPVCERFSQNFDSPGPYSRMFYRLTGTMLFDVHVRTKAASSPASAPDQAATKPPSPAPLTSVAELRAELIYGIWKAAGFPAWTAAEAFQVARDQHPQDHPLLLGISDSSESKCWTTVKAMRDLEPSNRLLN